MTADHHESSRPAGFDVPRQRERLGNVQRVDARNADDVRAVAAEPAVQAQISKLDRVACTPERSPQVFQAQRFHAEKGPEAEPLVGPRSEEQHSHGKPLARGVRCSYSSGAYPGLFGGGTMVSSSSAPASACAPAGASARGRFGECGPAGELCRSHAPASKRTQYRRRMARSMPKSIR